MDVRVSGSGNLTPTTGHVVEEVFNSPNSPFFLPTGLDFENTKSSDRDIPSTPKHTLQYKREAKKGEGTMISLELAPPLSMQFLIRGHHFRVHGILSYTHTGIRIHAPPNGDPSSPLSLRISSSRMIFHTLDY